MLPTPLASARNNHAAVQARFTSYTESSLCVPIAAASVEHPTRGAAAHNYLFVSVLGSFCRWRRGSEFPSGMRVTATAGALGSTASTALFPAAD